MNISFYETDLGRIGIAADANNITNVFFSTDAIPQNADFRATELLKEASQQLYAYLAGDICCFTLPLAPQGTEFMRNVWRHVCEIQYGQTTSYREIAIAVASPKAVRAVGMANSRNPIPIFIPCHRVVGSNGKLVGYRGGLVMKAKLLELEHFAFAHSDKGLLSDANR